MIWLALSGYGLGYGAAMATIGWLVARRCRFKALVGNREAPRPETARGFAGGGQVTCPNES